MEEQLVSHIDGKKYNDICNFEMKNLVDSNCLNKDKEDKNCSVHIKLYYDCIKFKKNKKNTLDK